MEQEYKAGDKIIQKGQMGTTFYMIKSGTVGFDLKDDGQIASTRSNGEFFGEVRQNNTASLVPATCMVTEVSDQTWLDFADGFVSRFRF